MRNILAIHHLVHAKTQNGAGDAGNTRRLPAVGVLIDQSIQLIQMLPYAEIYAADVFVLLDLAMRNGGSENILLRLFLTEFRLEKEMENSLARFSSDRKSVV